jgi:alkylhydroperoxidase/carboxymuconolactone decarboxylase family protein YurZ
MGVGMMSRIGYAERLRRLAINDERWAECDADGAFVAGGELDAKTLALVRLAALVAVGGAVPSYGAQADAAVSAGATVAEIVDVLVGVVRIVGFPCVVAAAPKLALALGCETDDVFEFSSGG